ncbi:hypothetical protein RRG08_056234 [Elysia crispata]|uniref:Uncharacterized protein n=1 Tax=Elysia crispata TaxID=231223 RepID=A0AAE1D0L3_9GAST|nr:hypothetical protein RRG08_056234 [Elysia crispata]
MSKDSALRARELINRGQYHSPKLDRASQEDCLQTLGIFPGPLHGIRILVTYFPEPGKSVSVLSRSNNHESATMRFDTALA